MKGYWIVLEAVVVEAFRSPTSHACTASRTRALRSLVSSRDLGQGGRREEGTAGVTLRAAPGKRTLAACCANLQSAPSFCANLQSNAPCVAAHVVQHGEGRSGGQSCERFDCQGTRWSTRV